MSALLSLSGQSTEGRLPSAGLLTRCAWRIHVLYKLRDSNDRLIIISSYCKLRQLLFWCCSLFLSGRNLFVFLRIVFNTVLLVCYSVLWPQISNKCLLTYYIYSQALLIHRPNVCYRPHSTSQLTLVLTLTLLTLALIYHYFCAQKLHRSQACKQRQMLRK